MKYIYIDESGDLGFKETSSRCFVFTAVLVDDERVLERVTKKVWKTFKNKRRGELHATYENDITRKRVLKMINNIEDINIVSVIFNKNKSRRKFQKQTNSLYCDILLILINNIFEQKFNSVSEGIQIFIDQKDMKKSVKVELIKDITKIIKENFIDNFTINFPSSQDNKSIQAIDFISWSIYRKYENDDDTFLKLITKKIILIREISP